MTEIAFCLVEYKTEIANIYCSKMCFLKASNKTNFATLTNREWFNSRSMVTHAASKFWTLLTHDDTRLASIGTPCTKYSLSITLLLLPTNVGLLTPKNYVAARKFPLAPIWALERMQIDTLALGNKSYLWCSLHGTLCTTCATCGSFH